jgi:plastocyanin
MDKEQKQNGYGKRPLWQWIVLYLVIGVIIYAGVYYFLQVKNSKDYSNSVTVSSNNSSTISPTIIQTQKVIIEGNEFAFTPSRITLKKGQVAEITFRNTGPFPHNLAIADLNVKTKTIQSGEQDTIQFTPDKTGQFAFICTVPGHADKGMKGILTVQ